VEQAAYEARLARLILLRRTTKKQKPNETANANTNNKSKQQQQVSPLDYVPALAFHDANKQDDDDGGGGGGTTTDDGALSFKTSVRSKTNTRLDSTNKKKSSTSSSLSFILKQKRARANNQTSRSSHDCNDRLEGDEYDAYWK